VSTERLFRRAALTAYRHGNDVGGVLELEETSAGFVYHLVVAGFLVFLGFVLCVPVNDYAAGRCVVRVPAARLVSTTGRGPVEHVLARSGQAVTKGQAIVELHQVEQKADLERIEEEFESLWVRVLRDPLDLTARDQLSSVQATLTRARVAVAERTFKAPIDGILTDVRVQEGRHVEPGDTLFVVEPVDAPVEIIAALPGSLRPQLDLEQSARFSVDGSDAWRAVELREISADVIGPNEAKRFLGRSAEDSIDVGKTSVIVTATIDTRFYKADGREYQLYQGMSGELEVRLAKKPIAFLLVPALRRWVYRNE
jgi:biotin carboxyl carrier protein